MTTKKETIKYPFLIEDFCGEFERICNLEDLKSWYDNVKDPDSDMSEYSIYFESEKRLKASVSTVKFSME